MEHELRRPNKFKALKRLVSVVTISSLAVFAILSGGFLDASKQFVGFLLGHSFYGHAFGFKTILGFVVLNLLVCVIASLLIYFLTGRVADSDKIQDLIKKLSKQSFVRIAWTIFVRAGIEELIFRMLPLTVLYGLFGGSNLWLFVIGSSVTFGVIHKSNFNKGRIIDTLPQMFGGFLYAYIYLAFGLPASILIHSLFNMTILTPFIYSASPQTADLEHQSS